jgi:hypothetical protein
MQVGPPFVRYTINHTGSLFSISQIFGLRGVIIRPIEARCNETRLATAVRAAKLLGWLFRYPC